MHHQDSNDAEEEVVPSVAALIGILLTGLLYLVLPPDVIIGPNWLLLVVEGVFVVPLVIDVMTAWNLSHTARRILVLVPLGMSTLALLSGLPSSFSPCPPINTRPIYYGLRPCCGPSISWSSPCGIGKLTEEVHGSAISPGIAPRIFCFHNKQLESIGCRIFWITCSSPLPRQPR